jgi:signal transduction histidine kinase
VPNSLGLSLREHRHSLARRWLRRVRERLPDERRLDDADVLDSLHLFIDEVTAALEADVPLGETGTSLAQTHGAQRLVLNLDIADIVREYGLLFEAWIEECAERGLGPFEPGEYARLVGLLSRGSAEAVREFASLRALELRRQAWEHFAFLAHEIRNPLQSALVASQLLRKGSSPERLAEVLERSLGRLSEAIDHALVDARLRGIDAGAALQNEPVDLRSLLGELADQVQFDAEGRRVAVVLDAPAPLPTIGDARVLKSALGNLVGNAVKFTRSGGKVTLRGRPGIVEIEDECGGLAPGQEKKIFQAFRQAGTDRSGFGLGLAIARQAIEAHSGTLAVRNLPGQGCIFVVTLAEGGAS